MEITLRRVLTWFWRCYMWLCTAVCSLIVFSVCYGILDDRYGYVALPGGHRLIPTAWWQEEIALKNSRGEIVVQPDITDIVWNEHCIRGIHRVRCSTECFMGANDIHFIYRLSDAALVEETMAGKAAYKAMEEECALPESVQIGPHTYTSTYKGYLDLRKDERYRRRWHR